MFKRKFKEEFEFSEDSFLLENKSKPKDFDRSIFVIYDKIELLDFLKLSKEEKNILLCIFNPHLYKSMFYFNEIQDLNLIDASKSRSEIFNDLKSYFKGNGDFVSKFSDMKMNDNSIFQAQSENFQRALFFYDAV